MKRMVLVLILLIALALAIPAGALLAQEIVEPSPEPGEIVIDTEEAAEGLVEASEEVATEAANVIEDFINRLSGAPQSDLLRALLVLGGAVLLVGGWRVYEFAILLAGIILGAAVGAQITANSEELIQIAAMVAGAVIGGLLAVYVYFVAVFLIGFYIGVQLLFAAAIALEWTPVSYIALLVAGFIGGIVLVALSTELLIVVASLIGAQMLTLGLGLSAEWTIVFALLGIVIQFLAARYSGYTTRRRRVRPVIRWRRT
jgi:hypothetical protein